MPRMLWSLSLNLDSLEPRHHDVYMRTTLTLEEDLARSLKELAHRKRVSFKQVINETLREGLQSNRKPAADRRRFRVRANHCGFLSGIDVGKLNQLTDELEAADFVAEE